MPLGTPPGPAADARGVAASTPSQVVSPSVPPTAADHTAFPSGCCTAAPPAIKKTPSALPTCVALLAVGSEGSHPDLLVEAGGTEGGMRRPVGAEFASPSRCIGMGHAPGTGRCRLEAGATRRQYGVSGTAMAVRERWYEDGRLFIEEAREVLSAGSLNTDTPCHSVAGLLPTERGGFTFCSPTRGSTPWTSAGRASWSCRRASSWRGRLRRSSRSTGGRRPCGGPPRRCGPGAGR
jgi:hypothetical protein